MTNFVHIGSGKTGTTSIQTVLAHNAGPLAERGFLYPSSGRIGNVHSGFYDIRARTFGDDNLQALEAELRERRAPHVVISSETLIHAPPALVVRMRRILGEDTRILVYVREQLGLLVSAFMQAVKSGANYRGSFDAYLDHHHRGFDFLQRIRPWAAGFGESSIVAHVYDRTVVGDNVATHFLSMLGLDDIEVQAQWLNPSLRPEYFDVVRRLDESGVSAGTRRQIVELLTHEPADPGRAGPGIVTREAHGRIRALYDASNREFGARFLQLAERDLLTVRPLPLEAAG